MRRARERVGQPIPGTRRALQTLLNLRYVRDLHVWVGVPTSTKGSLVEEVTLILVERARCVEHVAKELLLLVVQDAVGRLPAKEHRAPSRDDKLLLLRAQRSKPGTLDK